MTLSPGRRKVSPELRAEVHERALGLCEYGHTSEVWQYVEFTMEHLVPIAAGGQTIFSNLALACFPCNRRKSDQRVAVDPEVGGEHCLFNPRCEAWNDHFAWSADGLRIVGATGVGRATVKALDLNRDRYVQLRSVDIALGRHPPPGDRRLQ